MKNMILTILLALSYQSISDQMDSIPVAKISNAEYAIYKYNSTL